MKKYRGVFLKNESELASLREANRIVAKILDVLERQIAPGIRTMELEETASALCREYAVVPSFKGYNGFPFTICCSVNEEIVHGFPSERRLKEGDIVSVDMGVIYEGFHGDSARTFAVGEIGKKSRQLLEVTRDALYLGIEQARVGNQLYDISKAIQEHVESFGFGIVRRFVGHGIGRKLHEKPEVPNFVPSDKEGLPLKQGMVLAIEPMVTLGSYEVQIMPDHWTAVTRDHSLSAHFEHSVAITAQGPEILSVSEAAA